MVEILLVATGIGHDGFRSRAVQQIVRELGSAV
jgi:hypothetical protein